MFELARLALSAVLAAALQITVLGGPAAAAPVLEFDSTALLSEAGPHSADPASTYSDNPVSTEFLIADPLAAPSVRDFPAVRAVGHLLQSREFELNILDDKFKSFIVPGSCLYADTTLRGFGENAEDCGFINPGEESGFFNLTFFAISGWALVIFAVAGLHYFYGYWRVRQWLRRMRAAGLVPRTANPRRSAAHGVRRASSPAKPRRRRYAS